MAKKNYEYFLKRVPKTRIKKEHYGNRDKYTIEYQVLPVIVACILFIPAIFMGCHIVIWRQITYDKCYDKNNFYCVSNKHYSKHGRRLDISQTIITEGDLEEAKNHLDEFKKMYAWEKLRKYNCKSGEKYHNKLQRKNERLMRRNTTYIRY